MTRQAASASLLADERRGAASCSDLASSRQRRSRRPVVGVRTRLGGGLGPWRAIRRREASITCAFPPIRNCMSSSSATVVSVSPGCARIASRFVTGSSFAWGGLVAPDLVRTVADLLLWLPEEAGRAMLADALRRRLCSVDEVRRQLARMGVRHGRDRAWSVLADLAASPYSEGEVKVHRLLRQAGIDGWVANAPVYDSDGLIGLVDLLFEGSKVVVEFDGRAFHSDDVAFQRDRTAAEPPDPERGTSSSRFTWDDLVHRAAARWSPRSQRAALRRMRKEVAVQDHEYGSESAVELP